VKCFDRLESLIPAEVALAGLTSSRLGGSLTHTEFATALPLGQRGRNGDLSQTYSCVVGRYQPVTMDSKAVTH
jgi:hypothetical protein